uniref:Vacuolar protein sorting 13 homolog A n=1 Tax=Scophthalmus maximus TaxID=52904 RepID=A0A8D3D9W2_SCOMX
MVFESVVVDVLNRFLGDYVVNLDSSQLKLGIWGGDAVLTNLEIKENALSELDIPFKVRAGHIGRLELKIPWKNLYTQSVEATLDGVYLLIVPTASIKYDAVKEEKQLQEARQRELHRIEETKQKAAEQENPNLEKQDTFVEKLVTQVIKNVQVKISNIHVRYEDDVSIQLCFVTLGSSYTALIASCFPSSQLVQLDSLFAYWNVNSILFSNHIFRPISADAKLRMNPRSDVDFSSPRLDLMVNLSEVAIELNRPQYISILELLGSVDLMSRNLPYRKYRPALHVHKNTHIWWNYVITAILEVDVKPRLHMWSWQHIRRHRCMVKRYRELYKTKITSKKPSEELLKQLEVGQHANSFFSLSGFDELLTSAEKAKLYTAIGYSEIATNPNLPKDVIYFLLGIMALEALTCCFLSFLKNFFVRITARLSLFEVTGLASSQPAPTLLSSRKAATGTGTPLLCFLLETNPVDETANQRLHVESQPLEIIYDAMTVNSMSAFFMPPDDLQLDELTNATLMKLEQFRDRTSTGLMYVIETQKILDLKVNLMASYVIIPQTGFYNGNQNILLLDLGHFQVRIFKIENCLKTLAFNIEDIMSRAYDSFDIQLSNGDWKKARKQKQSLLHILEPVDLKMDFSRAMVVTDSRMAKYKMFGELPLLSLRISDVKLRSVLELVESIPLPESRPAARSTGPSSTPKFSVQLCRLSGGQEVTVLHLDIDGLGTELKLRTFDMTSNTFLREICLKCPEYMADEEVFAFRMVNYTDATEGDAYLDMSKVDTSVTLTVGCIQVIFLNKFVSSILAFINNFQEAKEALAEVTVHAAEKAASGVKELAERSTRIALNVHFNAPVIFLPQSSSSSNVIVADLGRLSVKNHFSKQPFKSDAKIPPVVDIMTVRLTDLKMYRATYINEGFQGETQLLMPVSLDLKIQRNLSSNWYHSIPDIEITAHLKPMSVSKQCFQQEELLFLCCSTDQHSVRGGDDIGFTTYFSTNSTLMFSPRMMAMRPGAEQNMMVEVNYRQGREGTTLDTVVQDVYLCASMEFLLTVADIFLNATQQGFAQVPQHKTMVSKTEMNVVVRNPEIVFVADLTRADAPALVMTTQCELLMKSGAEGSNMTAVINDLKVLACPFLIEKRKNNVTTVLQPCQVFFQSTQTPTTPQAMEVSINALTLKVGVLLLILHVLNPGIKSCETFESGIELLEFVFHFIGSPSLQVTIKSICLTLEAGVGHRTVPMLLVKSSFLGDVTNWSTLINLHSELNLEVHYYNEVMGVWEPLLEPLEDESGDGFRSWRLELKMKKKPTKFTLSDEVDYNVPDYKTVITISSKDQLNITLSKFGLAMLSNLGTAFAEAAKQTAECFQKDGAPFVVKNRLGLPVSVRYSEMFCPIEKFPPKKKKLLAYEAVFISLSSPAPVGHTSASVIPLIKVGRGMYSVMHNDSGVTRFLVCQIYSVEGSKYIKIRSPFQIINHFTIPFKVFEGSTCLGTAFPTEEFCVPLDSYRSELSLQPITEDDAGDQFECSEGIGENFDVPFVLHLWPSILLRNLLPYPIAYDLKATLDPGHSAQLHTSLREDDEDYGEGTERTRAELDIAVHVKYDLGETLIAIHSPYWMVNNTGRLLQYKADDIHRKHPLDYDMPLLFSFKPRYFLKNNKVRLMISDSEASDDFSLDTVGSHGDVKCKGRYKDYLVGVKIDASSFSLTRIVTFVPFYMLVNRTKHSVFICEEGQDNWSEAQPEQKKFSILLPVPQVGGIIVDVNLSDHSATIRFSEYHDGAAPFLIINHTKDQTLKIHQSSQEITEQEELEPGRAVHYTWAKPTGSRELCWNCGTYNGTLKSLQRVVLFTEEQRIYKLICESEKVQLAEQEIILSLKNMGVSLVNNSNSQEVSFIGITSSDVVWELKPKKKNRWKTLSTKEAEMLENSFKKYIECAPFNIYIHFLLQIQNQLPGAIFPYVFYPVKLPKSITMDSEPKPLTDISIVTRAAGHSDISRIKYFKVLIQEMDLKLDLGFLYAILDLFTPENVELFEKDIEYIKTELNHVSAADTSPISLYEYFHISPIKLHLSFSLSTGGEDGLKAKRDKEIIPVQSLNLLLKSIGATLTDVQDVVFKLAFFELTFQFCTTQQLQWEVIRHYSKQAIKQMYVLVLGLDVLGNPFGLIRGLSEGVEAFFYEPYQGAIQGPEEFVEGMALGVKALVGGAVGGIAGAASRITGAMAKGVAAITMDEEYQQKRREAMNKQPSGLREGLTRGGKGLGFVSGITGIVTKPIKGAQKEGAAGFFKGLGKGLVGAVARPTGGIIDMASSTFQGIKRAAETSQDIESLRPPRFIHEDGVIRPYKEREGLGSQMLQVGKKLRQQLSSSLI